MYWHNHVRFYYQQNPIIVDHEMGEESVMKIEPSNTFRVFAIDFNTYFIKNLDSLDFSWCYANKLLVLGEVVNGQLLSAKNAAELPTLVINE